MKWILVLLLLAGTVDSQEYRLNLTLGAEDFMGVCDEEAIQGLSISAFGECIGNAVTPSIPNPLDIFSPIMGSRLDAKLRTMNFLPYKDGKFDVFSIDLVKIANALLNFPLVIFYTFIEMVFSILKFILVFTVRFVFTYLFWVSLGYQGILSYVNSGAILTQKDKIYSTFAFMFIGSVFILAYGGGWISGIN